MTTRIEYLDRPAAGWFPLAVTKASGAGRKWDWCVLMIDVHPDELKHCHCKVAWLYVHPDDYNPTPGRVAQEAWVRLPGKYRDKEAAWDAALDFIVSSMN